MLYTSKAYCRILQSDYINKKPEMGDLLLIYKEVNRKGNRYNALLLQAKKTSNIYNSPVDPHDKHQLALYTQWPKFRYHRAGILNGQERSICPKTVSTGLSIC